MFDNALDDPVTHERLAKADRLRAQGIEPFPHIPPASALRSPRCMRHTIRRSWRQASTRTSPIASPDA